MSASELLTQVLKLPRHERQQLIEQVWNSLEREESEWDDDQSVDPMFVEELQRRVEMVQSGDFESMTIEESSALARKALAEARR